MTHSYVSSLYHAVFSTKGRAPIIAADLQEHLHPMMGGIARDNKVKALAIGGVKDHVHMLLSLPSTMDIARALRLIKGGSSHWVSDEYPMYRNFAWQEGYSAFSIGISQVKSTMDYINNQERRHQKVSFEDEYISFLKKHGIKYDPRFVVE